VDTESREPSDSLLIPADSIAQTPMPKTLLDCGNCGPDFNAIRQMVKTNFRASVVQSHGAEDTLELLRTRQIDLVTVNRKLDRDYSDGMDVIKAIKADPDVGSVPVMLVTNYEEHQQAAIEAGCVRGFGKLVMHETSTRETLEPYLGSDSA
jgi:CheY-like chemotaxis protein